MIKSLSIPKVSIRQIKAARALLAWTQEQLGQASGISVPTIKRLESRDGPIGGRGETAGKIQAALETAGIDFIDENGDGPGVRLRKRVASKTSRKSNSRDSNIVRSQFRALDSPTSISKAT